MNNNRYLSMQHSMVGLGGWPGPEWPKKPSFGSQEAKWKQKLEPNGSQTFVQDAKKESNLLSFFSPSF